MEHVDMFVSAISGSAIAAVLARYLISKALGDLDTLGVKVIHISQILTAISVRLEKLEEHDANIKDHAKRIAHIEGYFFDERRPTIHS
jgi:hypothetical protein